MGNLTELQKCVNDHWNNNLIYAIRFYRTGDFEYLGKISTSFRACAYCQAFYNSGCSECPVKLLTDTPECRDTPYLNVCRIKDKIYEMANKECYVKNTLYPFVPKEMRYDLLIAIIEECKFLKRTYEISK